MYNELDKWEMGGRVHSRFCRGGHKCGVHKMCTMYKESDNGPEMRDRLRDMRHDGVDLA
jgi:hypothetical protein